MRSAVFVLAGVSLAFAGLPAAAQSTTRVETGPFHGATVTVEEGVRVFRPVSPHDTNAKQQVSLGSGQPDTCACDRSYLRHVGEAVGSSRHLRRIGETPLLSGPR